MRPVLEYHQSRVRNVVGEFSVQRRRRESVVSSAQDEGVVGAEWVESHGGRVVLARLREGYSTSNTLKRLGSDGTREEGPR